MEVTIATTTMVMMIAFVPAAIISLCAVVVNHKMVTWGSFSITYFISCFVVSIFFHSIPEEKITETTPPFNNNLTLFLEHQPVKNGELHMFFGLDSSHSANVEIAARERKMNSNSLRHILNHEAYLIWLPPGYTVKVIPPDKAEVTEIPKDGL